MAVQVALMIEGQDGLTWGRWQRIAAAVESAGLAGLYRSDHFTNADPPDRESLEAWISLAWLASQTRSLEFGPLVSPVSFRDPIMLARMAAQVDDLSGGRLQLGLGAGWQAREHTLFGYPLLDKRQRMDRFSEALEVVARLLREEGPVSFEGAYYRLEGARLLPRPARVGGPPIVIGGNGPLRTLPLVARYADEWNAVGINATAFAEANGRLNLLLDAAGRPRGAVRRSLMTQVAFGRDEASVEGALEGRTRAFARQKGILFGTAPELVDQLGALAEVGVERVMLRWVDLDDTDGIEALGTSVIPRL